MNLAATFNDIQHAQSESACVQASSKLRDYVSYPFFFSVVTPYISCLDNKLCYPYIFRGIQEMGQNDLEGTNIPEHGEKREFKREKKWDDSCHLFN